MDLYILANGIMVGLSIFCLIVLFINFRYGLNKTAWAVAKQKRIHTLGVLGLSFWILLITILSINGFFRDYSGLPPRQALIFIPFILMLIFVLSNTAKEIIMQIPPTWLIIPQSFRILVEIALWLLFLDGTCPEQMTFEGYNFDILAGLTAPIVAYFCFVKNKWSKSIAIVWNIGSLALLTTIVTISILSMPTQFRVFMNEPANTMIAEFPMIHLPVILVFTAYTLHLFSLRQLLSSNISS